MVLPTQSVTLTVDQVADLNRQLATMRHDINNHLSLIGAAVELIRQKPQTTERMINTMAEQPAKISDSMSKFTADFEKFLNITR